MLRRKRAGERVEIASVATQAMHADHHRRIVALAPFGVRHPVQAARMQALDGFDSRQHAVFLKEGLRIGKRQR